MMKVEYIDSSGLGALVGGLKRSTEHGGRIVIVCDNPQIRKVFEITGLEKVFPLYDVEADRSQEAWQSGAEPTPGRVQERRAAPEDDGVVGLHERNRN